MVDEKDDQLYKHAPLPIPSYEEATSSRPASSRSGLGPEEISDDAERQGLLQQPASFSTYRPPTVESDYSSLDFLPSDDGSENGSTVGLRRELEQLEVEEPDADNGSHRSLLSNRLSKRLNSLTSSLSSFHIPFRRYIPTFTLPRLGPSTWVPDENYKIVIVGRMVGAMVIIAFVYLLLASDVLSLDHQRKYQQQHNPEHIRSAVQGYIINHNEAMREYLVYLTQGLRSTGTKGSAYYADWIEHYFEKSGLEDVEKERFDVFLNFPKDRARQVTIFDPPHMRWTALIEEDHPSEYRDTQYNDVFHGLSKGGEVSGHLIYAKDATKEDFAWLKENSILLEGAIVMVRSGGPHGDDAYKIKSVEAAGAAGCIIFSDSQVQAELWVDTRHIPKDLVSRSSVSLRSWVLGDVLSPGWASTAEEKKRLTPQESPGLVGIPSLPLSWRDAEHLLQALRDHGKVIPGQGGRSGSEEYWSGDRYSPQVMLRNIQDEVDREPIINVLGRIPGWEQPEKKVIVGNHRDAWCIGALGPGSGTVVMLGVVHALGELRKTGWRPLRTIEFASWDGGEYNLIGSTEHVENEQEALRWDGVAYMNIDVGVGGQEFWAAASPLYESSLMRILKRTSDPVHNRTLHDLWSERNGRLEGLGAASDFAAFQDIVGTSSIDLGFRGQSFPRGSCYDDYRTAEPWAMQDPSYFDVLGQIIALLILDVADRPILPFDMRDYAKYLDEHVRELDDYIKQKAVETKVNPLNIKSLFEAAGVFKSEAESFHDWDEAWENLISSNSGYESSVMAIQRMSHNNKGAGFETALLDLEEGGGLPGRDQFKHVLYAPKRTSSKEASHFPSIRDAVEDGDWKLAALQAKKVTDILNKAVHKLNHNG